MGGVFFGNSGLKVVNIFKMSGLIRFCLENSFALIDYINTGNGCLVKRVF